jgi:Dna[CI] antecedent DciA-like protein
MEAVRTGLRHIMQDLLRARPAEEAVILAWPLVCGKEVAARTQAINFSDGTLIVEVPDAAWRSQLSAFIPRYTGAFNDLLGSVVKQIRFQVSVPGPARRQ